MAEEEELLGSGDASTAMVAVRESEATVGGGAEAVAGRDDMEVRPKESLLPLQDLWYCSSSLFPAVGTLEVSPFGVPKKWILKGEVSSNETAWVPAASGILNLWF